MSEGEPIWSERDGAWYVATSRMLDPSEVDDDDDEDEDPDSWARHWWPTDSTCAVCGARDAYWLHRLAPLPPESQVAVPPTWFLCGECSGLVRRRDAEALRARSQLSDLLDVWVVLEHARCLGTS